MKQPVICVRSYRDLKSGLAISRKKTVLCRTSRIEESILRELETKYGEFKRSNLTESLALKEKHRKQKYLRNLENSRLKLFMSKERMIALQRERVCPSSDSSRPLSEKEVHSENVSSDADLAPKVKRIEFGY